MAGDTALFLIFRKMTRMTRRRTRVLLRPILEFLRLEASGGILLVVAAVLALVWANSPWGATYDALWHTPLTLGVGAASITHDLHFWINEALMVLFFLVVGLEIKREILVGEMASLRKSALPVTAALGGMIAPALIYLLLNPPGTTQGMGWGIPTATDIAFAIGVLTLMGDRVPLSLKVFLMALAIVDDLGAIVLIALFYSQSIAWGYLGAAFGVFLLLMLLNRMRVRPIAPYAVLGLLLWLAFLKSGIHATLSGVVLAFAIPARLGASGEAEAPHQAKALEDSEAVADIGEDSPLAHIQHHLHPWVTYAILPLFALANAGVVLQGGSLAATLSGSVSLGVMAGLVLGKPLGITAMSWLACKLRMAQLPDRITWPQMWAVSCLGGIGFTMSIFIASLAFGESNLLMHAKLGIIVASVLSGLLGWLFLSRTLKGTADAAGDEALS